MCVYVCVRVCIQDTQLPHVSSFSGSNLKKRFRIFNNNITSIIIITVTQNGENIRKWPNIEVDPIEDKLSQPLEEFLTVVEFS